MKGFLILILLWFFTNYTLNSQQISYKDRHNQVLSDAWVSLTKTLSPNVSRGVLHWVKLDLGDTYALSKSKFWNINTPGRLNIGVKSMVIDYSLDGVNWLEWGRYELEQGNGSTWYEGEQGPNFAGLIARHILINIVENYGNINAAGLAELKIDVSPATVNVDDVTIKDASLKVYPNPFNKEATVIIEGIDKFENLSYQITDMTGRLIKHEKVNDKIITVDASNLITGLYNFTIIHPNGLKSIQLDVVK